VVTERPELAGPVAFLRDVLPRLYEEPVVDPVPVFEPDQAAAKLAGGLPLLRGEVIRLDGRAFQRRWQHVCTAVQRHQDRRAGERLAAAIRNGQLDANELTAQLLAGGAQPVHAQADRLSLDPGLFGTVLRLTLLPTLAHVNAALAPLREGSGWNRGYCPTCGSWPVVGEFRGLEETRYLRCRLCTSEWQYPRLRCPFCAAHNHRLLGYVHVEGEETKYRAATCDACRGYIKMVSSLGALSRPQLLVAELATMHLDLAALARNYLPQV
jgi:FdhE protein